MQGAAWIGLLRRVPAAMHDCLVLMTVTGTQIVLQRLIRLDRDFLVALGRLAGSTDQPKMLIVPYSQMVYLSFNKKLTDEEIQSAIGKPGMGEAAESEAGAEPVEIVDFPHPASAASAEPAPGAGPAATPRPTGKVAPPSKSILLARLRERLAGDITRPAGSNSQ
jgi:hypothetical protein